LLTISDDEFGQALIARVRSFPGQEKVVWDYYQKNPEARAEIRAPLYEEKVVDHILALFFDEDLFYANAGVFRRDLHDHIKKNPQTKHLIIDAVAMSDIDYTALVALSRIVDDLTNDHVSVSMARANENVKSKLAKSTDKAIRHIKLFDSVDAAATDALDGSKN